MKLEYRNQKENLNIFSARNGLRLEKVFCAVAWTDLHGIGHRMESLEIPRVAFRRKQHTTTAVFKSPDCPTLSWKITNEGAAVILTATVINTTKSRIRIRTIEPIRIDFGRGGRVCLKKNLNQAYLLCQRRVGGEVSPVYIWDELYRRNRFSADTMCCLYNKDTEDGLTLGFITTKNMFGQFILDFDSNLMAPDRFYAQSDAEDRELAPCESLTSEKLWINLGPARKGIEQYAVRTAREMQALNRFAPLTGWSTWDYFFGDINEDNILGNVKFLREHRNEIPVEYIQLDAGYCDGNRNWTDWNDGFPHGPRWLVNEIKKLGFKAGLWLIPFYAHKNSELAAKHPDWLVKDRDGKPVVSLENSFVLDGTHPEAQAWLAKLARTITREWGFEYIKFDGASMIGMARGVHHNSRATGCQAYRQGIEAFRKGMEKHTFLMGGVNGPSIGTVDGMRVGEDVGARWDWSKIDVHRGERDRYHGSGNIKRAITTTLNSYYMNRKIWINDGDYLVVRDDRSELTLNEARVWASILGLYGGSVILSDNMPTLKKERLEIITKILPVYNHEARPADFLRQKIPAVLALDVRTDFADWKIVGLLNYDDKPVRKEIDFKALKLDGKEGYHVYEFWEQKYYGIYQNMFSTALEPHSCQILAVRKNVGRPQIIGTDLHITQGAVEIENVRWRSPGALNITLKAIGRKTGNITLYLPDKWELKKCSPAGVGVQPRAAGKNLVKLAVQYEGRLNLSLDFKSGPKRRKK